MAFCVNKEHEQNSKILSEWTNEHEHSKLPILRNEQAKMNKFHEKIWKKYFWKKPVQLEWLVLTRKITFYSWIEQIFLKIQLSLIQSTAFKFVFPQIAIFWALKNWWFVHCCSSQFFDEQMNKHEQMNMNMNMNMFRYRMCFTVFWSHHACCPHLDSG